MIVDDRIQEAAKVGIVRISHVGGTALASEYALGSIRQESPEHDPSGRIDRRIPERLEVWIRCRIDQCGNRPAFSGEDR